MKKITFGLSLLFLGTFAQAQGLENIIVEKYYVSNAADAAGSIGTLSVGSVTYRVFADMKPGYKFQVLYGNSNHELKIKTSTKFFNNEDRGATTPNGISVTNTKKNTVMLDSWFSVGATATGKIGVLKSEDTDGTIGNSDGLLTNNDLTAGIALTTQDGMVAGTPEAVTIVGLTTELDPFDQTSLLDDSLSTKSGAISALNGAVGATASNMVLLGQFTTDGLFSFELNIQIGTPTPGGVEKYVAKNATGSELTLASLTYPLITDVKHTTINNSEVSLFKAYPSPTKDILSLEFNSSKSNTVSQYAIYDVVGNLISQNDIWIAAGGKHTENIDISLFANGLYFITVSIDGVASTQKIVKN